jgi:ABC-type antimicrobial peptide transport system permease subunit
MRPAVIGLSIGLVGLDAATRVMSSMLYGIANDDPVTIAVVAAALLGVAGLACLLPASRITKTNPMDALRQQ